MPTQGQVPKASSRLHANDLQLGGARIFQSCITNRRSRAVGKVRESGLEILEIVDFLAVERADQGRARNAGTAENITGICDIHSLDGHVEMPRLLVGQRVQHGFAEFDVLVRRDGAQRLDV
jgi:hypothetical protein